MDLNALAALGSIILIDLILSGDNAVVIGMAASDLPGPQRRRAILWGTLGAVGLRVLFTALAALLLHLPLLQLLGGLLLFWVAFKLLTKQPNGHEAIGSGRSLSQAIGLIITADAVMSLDNMLAVAAASQGHLLLLMLGLAISIPLLMVGASLIAQVMGRMPWLIWLGGATIVWIATRMIVNDPWLDAHWGRLSGPAQWALLGGTTGLILLISWLWNRRSPSP